MQINLLLFFGFRRSYWSVTMKSRMEIRFENFTFNSYMTIIVVIFGIEDLLLEKCSTIFPQTENSQVITFRNNSLFLRWYVPLMIITCFVAICILRHLFVKQNCTFSISYDGFATAGTHHKFYKYCNPSRKMVLWNFLLSSVLK